MLNRLKIFNIVLLIAVNIAVGIFFAKCISSAINRHSASAWVFTLMTSNLRSCTHYLNRYGSIRYRIFKCDNQHNLYSCINYSSCCGVQAKTTRLSVQADLQLFFVPLQSFALLIQDRLNQPGKILSYFAFGAILIIISFVYQKFSKRLENEAVSITDDDKNK